MCTRCAPDVRQRRRHRSREPALSDRTQQEARRRYAGAVSQVEPDVIAESEALDDDERSWLDERLQEYEELLVYLHDH